MAYSFVIAGGSSLTQMPLDWLSNYGTTYGVNDASIHADVEYAVTMDRLWFENRWEILRNRQQKFVAIREGCDKKVSEHTAKVYKHLRTLHMHPKGDTLAGSHSGAFAMNLAFHNMLPGDTLFLLGFDMCAGPNGESYWYPPYSWSERSGATKKGNSEDWREEMKHFCAQFTLASMNVFNVNTPGRTKVDFLPMVSFEQMANMLGCSYAP